QPRRRPRRPLGPARSRSARSAHHPDEPGAPTMNVELDRRTIPPSGYGDHPEEIVRHAATLVPDIEVEVRYRGDQTVWRAIVLDNIVIPAIADALRGVGTEPEED